MKTPSRRLICFRGIPYKQGKIQKQKSEAMKPPPSAIPGLTKTGLRKHSMTRDYLNSRGVDGLKGPRATVTKLPKSNGCKCRVGFTVLLDGAIEERGFFVDQEMSCVRSRHEFHAEVFVPEQTFSFHDLSPKQQNVVKEMGYTQISATCAQQMILVNSGQYVCSRSIRMAMEQNRRESLGMSKKTVSAADDLIQIRAK